MRIIRIIALVLAVIIILCFVFILLQIRERYPDYDLNLRLPAEGEVSGQLKVGFASALITPELPDIWTDSDNDARYEPCKGDSYIDGNGNGKFDAYWLSGFYIKRAANGIHDDILARAIVWDDSATVVGLVVLDAIGFFHDDVVTVRKMVAERIPEIDHLIISSTHSHEVPDLIGLYGKSYVKSGVNREYLELVREKAAEAVCNAYASRKPATLEFAQIDSIEKDIVVDNRKPIIYDDCIRLLKVNDKSNGQLMGLLVNFGNHPETAGSRNLLITADFVHYLREGIENGIWYDGSKKRDGIGGTVIFANGAVGGIMSGMFCETYDPWIDTTFAGNDNSFGKVQAQGYRLADTILDKIEYGTFIKADNPSIDLLARTFYFRIKNPLFRLGAYLGVIDRGIRGCSKIRSEVDLLTIGRVWFLTLPGEVNPEIVNGGIESPEGRDFEIAPVEVPPFREMMRGEINFVVGLANDEVGYIMPKSHWDKKRPFCYGEDKAPYGESNSTGPEAGPKLYEQVSQLIGDMR
jgi:hypothetical protein